MDTSLISALFSVQVGQLQLAAAAFLARNNPQSASSVEQLVNAAQQNSEPLAGVSADLGTKVDMTC